METSRIQRALRDELDIKASEKVEISQREMTNLRKLYVLQVDSWKKDAIKKRTKGLEFAVEQNFSLDTRFREWYTAAQKGEDKTNFFCDLEDGGRKFLRKWHVYFISKS